MVVDLKVPDTRQKAFKLRVCSGVPFVNVAIMIQAVDTEQANTDLCHDTGQYWSSVQDKHVTCPPVPLIPLLTLGKPRTSTVTAPAMEIGGAELVGLACRLQTLHCSAEDQQYLQACDREVVLALVYSVQQAVYYTGYSTPGRLILFSGNF